MKYKNLPTKEQRAVKRFLSKFNMGKKAECWEWESTLINDYGVFKYKYLSYLAHRFSYEFFTGDKIGDMVIDHFCENKKCVNPNHLGITTIQENIRRFKKNNPNLYCVSKLPKFLILGHCSKKHSTETINDLYLWKCKDKTYYRCKECERIRKSAKNTC